MQESISTKTPFTGFFRRGLAGLMDLVLIFLLVLSLSNASFTSAAIDWVYTTGGLVSTVMYDNSLNLLLFVVVLFAYRCITESIWGSSLGELIFRQKVVGLQKEKVSFSRILLRNIVLPIDLIFGSVFFFFSKKNQVLGDQLARTIVINKKSADLLMVDINSKSRKVTASILLVCIMTFVVLTIHSICQISKFNALARSVIENTQKNVANPSFIYDMFGAKAKKIVTLDDVTKQLNEPVFQDILKRIEADKVRFYYWKFNSTEVVMIGSQNDVGIRIALTRDGQGSWKVLDFRVK